MKINVHARSVCGLCLVVYEDIAKPHVVKFKDRNHAWKVYCNDAVMCDTDDPSEKDIIFDGNTYRVKYSKLGPKESVYDAVDRMNDED
jgi:hypothetical protein